MFRKLLATLVAAGLILFAAACGDTGTGNGDPTPDPGNGDPTNGGDNGYDDVVTYDFMFAWNGGASAFPYGFENGSVAQVVEEETGVRLNVETIVTSESENLARVFAAGIVPDIVNAPFWNTLPGGTGELIKEAAVDGLLLSLNPYYENYPNVERMMFEGVSDLYLTRDLEHPEFEGEYYVIPQQTPRTDEDVINWAYNVWVRGDILEDLGYEQSDINTSERLYELMVEIQEGGYTDINGNPVIPSGAWHNGWSYAAFLDSFTDGTMTGWHLNDDGELVNDMLSDLQEERILFMRRLVDENLFDPEALTHTDSQAKEKAATGRVAILNGHYPHNFEFFSGTLYVEHPEMRYVPVGPIENIQGEPNVGWERHGRTGSPGIFFSADIEQPERAFHFIDFINSDEGLLLVNFGIEGEHYNMEDDVPTLTEDWLEVRSQNLSLWYGEGFGLQHFVGADPSISRGWDPSYNEEGYVEAREYSPMDFFDGVTADQLAEEWPGRIAYDQAMATINWEDEVKRAYLAESDERAFEILNNYRQRMIDAGLEEMTEYVNEAYAEDDSILY